MGTVGTALFTIDKTTPTGTDTEPATGAIDVPVNSKINATFSEAMDIDGSAGNFSVLAEDGVTTVDGTVSWSADNTTATFTPTSNLDTSPSYTITIQGGTDGIKDKAGNPMAINYAWKFSTPASITMTLTPQTYAKWGQEVKATVIVTNTLSDDKISVDWGDGSQAIVITTIPAGDQYEATHTYPDSAVSTVPHQVVAKLLTIGNVERASTGAERSS